MSMLRKILIGVALLIIVLVGVGAYLIHRLNSEMAQNSYEALQKLQPRVITGAGRLDKNPFYAGSNLGEITQILVGWPADREGAALTVIGNKGADFLDARAGLKMQIQFSKYVPCSVEAVRLDASGDYGFLTRAQSWAVDVVLFDKTGQERWSYSGGLSGIDDSVMGDVGGDGKTKVVVGFNGGGGLVVLDGERKQVWKKSEGNVWHVEILDTRGDGRKEILHTNAQGQLLVRDASGEVIAHYLPNYYVSDFALTRWGIESQPSHILVPAKESADQCCKPVFLVLDAQGRIVAYLDAPLSDLMQEANGTRLRYPRNVEYYAVLQSKESLKRSVLSLYNHEGQMAYQEVLGDYCLGITAFPGELGDRLLVGCSGEVWEYFAARAEDNSARPAR
jgi:hypothetical protein